MAKTSKQKRAEWLELASTMNFATVAQLLANGASEDFVAELRDTASKQSDEAARLRERMRPARGSA